MRATTSCGCCALLLTAALFFAAALPAAAQPAEIDWRSALILRFEPLDATQGGSYLSRIAEDLASGWIAGSGIQVIAIGPLFGPADDAGEGIGQPIGEGIGQPVIDPSLGTPDDWMRLISEAEQAGVVVALHVKLPQSSEACSGLAKWIGTSGVRHLFVKESGGCEVSALRTALAAAGADEIWTAEVRGGGQGLAGTTDAWNNAGDVVDEFGERTTDAEDGQPEPNRRSSGAIQPPRTRFDAVVGSISVRALDDDGGLGEFYKRLARRVDEAPEPLVAGVTVPPESMRLAIRALMLPGAVQITAPAPPSAASDLWRSIAAFRSRHPAVSRGEHVELVNNAFAFARTSTERGLDDRVVVVLGASGNTTLNVSRIFPDNAMLQDALTGRTAFVSFGMATFEAGPIGIILVEEANEPKR